MSEKNNEPVKQEGDFKIKSKKRVPKKLTTPEETIKMDMASAKKEEPAKIDLSKTKEKQDAVQKQETESSVLREEGSEVGLQKVGQTHEEPAETVIKEIPVEENKEEKEIKKQVEEAVRDEKVLGKPLPENIEKLVNFMEETGGTIEDYTRLNADYTNVDETILLKEYYKKSKPHLDLEEINFIMEEKFDYDTDIDEEREVKRKKLAKKEEVAKAKNYLEDLKIKYYEEIKLRPGVTQDQQKAMDFFNRYNKQQEVAEKQHELFKQKTKELFNNDFKGFDINVGDKKFKYNIVNRDKVAENQSNINNLVGKFLDNDGNINDHAGYHKAIYAAENVDRIAAHFYEQGKADAVKDVVNKSKNLVDTEGRKSQGDVFIGGMKVKAISGADSSKLKIKTKRFN